MNPRDPEPGGAPEGEPADGRFPAPPSSLEPSAAHLAETAAAPEPVPAADSAPPAARRGSWRAWRGRRPFLGGVLMTLGGLEILFTERASIGVVVHIGMQGLSGYLIPAVLVVCGVLTVFNPAQRLFYSILGVLLSLGSWATSNLGGFFVGLLLGVLGSCLVFGWLPEQRPREGLIRKLRTRRTARL